MNEDIFIGVVCFIALSWYVLAGSGVKLKLGTDYSEAWWKGAEYQTVCNAVSDKCYTLLVEAKDSLPFKVHFNNGGYLVRSHASCHEAASFYDFDRLCRFWDQDDARWDIHPVAGH
jgi:hypothetical protein